MLRKKYIPNCIFLSTELAIRICSRTWFAIKKGKEGLYERYVMANGPN